MSALWLATALVLLAAAPAAAAEYWVAPGGNDAGAGTATAPWATLQHAADRVAPGDTVYVRDGSYVGFNLGRSGTAGSPIRFVAEGAGARITQRNATTPDGINLEGADHVLIDGFVVSGMPRAGVRCASGRFITVRRIRADANQRWGIFTACCPDVVIEDNVTTNSVKEHGIYFSNSADRPVIRRNLSSGNHVDGIHMNGDLSIPCGGVTATDGVISGALVERNVVFDNGRGGGSGINCDGVSDSIFRNNLVDAAHASGISLYSIDAGAGSRGNRIVNNTIVVTANGRWAVNIRNGSTGNLLRNNVLLTYHSLRGSIVVTADSRSGFSSDFNVLTPRLSANGDATILDLAQWQALGYDANSVSSMPSAVFVDAPGNDHHLRAGSPAIDRADRLNAPADDLEGNLRDSMPDIGAYERGAAPAADAAPRTDGPAPGTDGPSPGDAQPPDAAPAPRGSPDAQPLPYASAGDAQGATDAYAASVVSSGCGCHLPGPSPASDGVALAALAALLGLGWKRSRKSAVDR